jgi:hypothetical protein
VGTGFDQKLMSEIHQFLQPLRTTKSPFAERVKLPQEIVWVRPELVCTVKYIEWTPDGRLRVKTEKVKALHVSVKGVMGVLGIELASVLNTSNIDGLDTDKNDLLMDLGSLLPPPHIKGKITAVRIQKNGIVTVFGDGEKPAPLLKANGNYMYFQGNPVRFGKLTMQNTDLTIFDLDPEDPLDWSQDHYKDQLVAGYSKITSSFGLHSYAKDFEKLPRSSSAAPSVVPTK